MKVILIIGAGFSGVVTAIQLIRQAQGQAIQVLLLNRSGQMARGLAYGTHSPDHTLNVPAGNMSALDDDPAHFLRYAQSIDKSIDSGTFVARSIYGDYLEGLLQQVADTAPSHVQLRRIVGQVHHLSFNSNSQGKAILNDGRILHADKVVLAFGNFAPSDPAIADVAFYNSARYIRDPWDSDKLAGIGAGVPILLLGTGLTAVDVSMSLLSENPERHIYALSRRGLLPQHHRAAAVKAPPGSPPAAIWGAAGTLRAQLRAFRQHARVLAAQGGDWRDALAALRPYTAAIWQAWPQQERRRFLRHVQPYWDSHRHRLAPAIHQRFAAAIQAGTVETCAARLRAMEADRAGVTVHLRRRGATADSTLRVGYVINCTGPCTDPRGTRNQLVRQLLADGLIHTDRLGLGLDVGPDGAVVGRDGVPSTALFYVGPWLKANYWEATAVPELRRYARLLAQTLLATPLAKTNERCGPGLDGT